MVSTCNPQKDPILGKNIIFQPFLINSAFNFSSNWTEKCLDDSIRYMLHYSRDKTTIKVDTSRVRLHMMAWLGVVERSNYQPPNQPGDPGPNVVGIEHRAEKSLAV